MKTIEQANQDLMSGIMNNSVDQVEEALKNGAEVTGVVLESSLRGAPSVELVELLVNAIKTDGTPFLSDQEIRSAMLMLLDLATFSGSGTISPPTDNQVGILQLFLQKCPQIINNDPNISPHTLTKAVQKADSDRFVTVLLDAGATVRNYTADQEGNRLYKGDTLYQALRYHQSLNLIGMLLDKGSLIVNDAVNADGSPDYESNTLYCAVDNQAVSEVIDVLLLSGATPESLGPTHPRREEINERFNYLQTSNKIADTATFLKAQSVMTKTEESAHPLKLMPERVLHNIATYSGDHEVGKDLTEDQRQKAADVGVDRLVVGEEESVPPRVSKLSKSEFVTKLTDSGRDPNDRGGRS